MSFVENWYERYSEKQDKVIMETKCISLSAENVALKQNVFDLQQRMIRVEDQLTVFVEMIDKLDIWRVD